MRGKKNTVSVSTNSNVSFCGTYGCSNLSLSSHRWVRGKWMSKHPNCKSNGDDEDDDDDDVDDDDDENDDDDADDETLRRGCCVKRRTGHVTRVHLGGGHGSGHSEQSGMSGSEKRAPHDVHGCSSLSPFLNSHLEVYIVRHTHRAGKKTRSVLAQTPMCLFAVPMDARTCLFHRTVGYGANGCQNILIASRMVMMRMMVMMMMLMMMMRMMTMMLMMRHCEGAAA